MCTIVCVATLATGFIIMQLKKELFCSSTHDRKLLQDYELLLVCTMFLTSDVQVDGTYNYSTSMLNIMVKARVASRGFIQTFKSRRSCMLLETT